MSAPNEQKNEILASTQNTPTEPPKGFQLPLDMTEIWKYDRMIEDLATINHITGPMFMKDFLKAKDRVASYHAKVMFEYESAKDKSAKEKAIAHLERAPVWLEQHGRKVTEAACGMYSDTDINYLEAREVEAYLKSLLTFLTHKLEKFQCAHDDSKKIFDKSTEPLGSRSSLPSGRDSQ
jgi:hypothetical protein